MPDALLIIKDMTGDRLSAVPNLLPCRIHHNGPVNPASEFWKPTQSEDSKITAYFRGRKLQAQGVPVPKDYRGVLAERVPREGEGNERRLNIDEDAEEIVVETMQVTGQFDKVLVWSHGGSPDPASDAYIRGIDEWLQVADKIHSCESNETDAT